MSVVKASDLSAHSSILSFDDTISSIDSINTDTLENLKTNLHVSFAVFHCDIKNESQSEKHSNATDQDIHENVYEYSVIKLDDYIDDYNNDDVVRDKSHR